MALILDTGPLYASLDRSDQDHAACRSLVEGADEALVIMETLDRRHFSPLRPRHRESIDPVPA